MDKSGDMFVELEEREERNAAIRAALQQWHGGGGPARPQDEAFVVGEACAVKYNW